MRIYIFFFINIHSWLMYWYNCEWNCFSFWMVILFFIVACLYHLQINFLVRNSESSNIGPVSKVRACYPKLGHVSEVRAWYPIQKFDSAINPCVVVVVALVVITTRFLDRSRTPRTWPWRPGPTRGSGGWGLWDRPGS